MKNILHYPIYFVSLSNQLVLLLFHNMLEINVLMGIFSRQPMVLLLSLHIYKLILIQIFHLISMLDALIAHNNMFHQLVQYNVDEFLQNANGEYDYKRDKINLKI